MLAFACGAWCLVYIYIYVHSGVQMTLQWGIQRARGQGGREGGCLPKVAGEGRQTDFSKLYSPSPDPTDVIPGLFSKYCLVKQGPYDRGGVKTQKLSQQAVASVDFGKTHHSTSFQSSKLIYDGKLKAEAFRATASKRKGQAGLAGGQAAAGGGSGWPGAGCSIPGPPMVEWKHRFFL